MSVFAFEVVEGGMMKPIPNHDAVRIVSGQNNLGKVIATDIDKAYTKREFYPEGQSTNPKEKHAAEQSLDAVVTAVETALFIAGPEGVVASAALGLVWSFVKPSAQLKVKKSVSSACSKAIKLGLDKKAVQDAVGVLRAFQAWLLSMGIFAEPKYEDDFKALDSTILKYLVSVTLPGGVLQTAFANLLPQVSWYEPAVELATGITLVSIFQAYMFRCMAYSNMAKYYRQKDRWHDYNTHLSQTRIAFADMSTNVPNLLKEVRQHIITTRETRLKNIEIVYDNKNADVFEKIYSGCGAAFRTAGYISEPYIKRKFTAAKLEGACYVGWGTKLTTEGNDNVMETYCLWELWKYRKGFEKYTADWCWALRKTVDTLEERMQEFVKLSQPADPKFAPLHVGSLDMKVSNSIPVGSWLSFRFVFVDNAGKPIAKSSPWSEWVQTLRPWILPQFLIGDGYALVETRRQIYMRVRKAGWRNLVILDEQGFLADTITGHGFLLWPEEDSEGHI